MQLTAKTPFIYIHKSTWWWAAVYVINSSSGMIDGKLKPQIHFCQRFRYFFCWCVFKWSVWFELVPLPVRYCDRLWFYNGRKWCKFLTYEDKNHRRQTKINPMARKACSKIDRFGLIALERWIFPTTWARKSRIFLQTLNAKAGRLLSWRLPVWIHRMIKNTVWRRRRLHSRDLCFIFISLNWPFSTCCLL